jgi:hypothetical protein
MVQKERAHCDLVQKAARTVAESVSANERESRDFKKHGLGCHR